MTVLSLQEAAQQIGTSKVDIWRAIQTGALAAHRTGDGGFAIDPAELSRVFAQQRPEQRPMGLDAPSSLQVLELPEAGETPEGATVTNDMSVAFAELQDQLRGLLERPAGVRSNDELRQDKDEQPDVIADKVATEMKPADEAAETPIPTARNEEVLKRAWWRRLAGRF
jgi:hypothetical protein